MRREQIEALLADAAANSGSNSFVMTVPGSELSASLTILKHLEAHGIVDSYSHREAELDCEDCGEHCGCIMIYGYAG